MSHNSPQSQLPGTGGIPPGPVARKPDPPKKPLSKRAYALNLTFSSLLTAAIVALIGLSWVFMLGVMVGRGYNPDAKVHEFAERVLRGGRTPAAAEPPQAVLRPEELNFSLALRNKPLHNSTATVGAPAAQTPARQPDGAAASGAAGNAASARVPQPPTQFAPPDTPPVLFDFVYQVATYRDVEPADKLRERLEGEGARTTLERAPARDGKTFYKVLVQRRCTEEDNERLMAVLERLRLGLPLLRSKKPVPGGEGAR